MNRLCTTQQQSQRLLEAGVGPDTADFYLQRITETDDWSIDNVQDQLVEPWMDKSVLFDMDLYYPAWSLYKLIDMMPPAIDGLGTLYLCAGLNTKKYKCSSFDLESVGHHDTYVGRRVRRGLFMTRDGILINADINGSYNIMRKVKGDAVMPLHTGFGYNPVKKFIN